MAHSWNRKQGIPRQHDNVGGKKKATKEPRCPECEGVLTPPLRAVSWWHVRYCGQMCEYESLARWFRKETGLLAPGKDESAAVNSGVTHEQRRAAWDAWLEEKRPNPSPEKPEADHG